jgi:hypothetical protein
MKEPQTKGRVRRKVRPVESSHFRVPEHTLPQRRWVPPPSGLGLIEEECWHDPWRMLVASVFLSRTRGTVAHPRLRGFFVRFPSPEALVAAAAGGTGAGTGSSPNVEAQPLASISEENQTAVAIENEENQTAVAIENANQTAVAADENQTAVAADENQTAADAEARVLREIEGCFVYLGMHKVRAARVLAMTRAYVAGGWRYPIELPGIGKYGNDCYRIFCLADEWRHVRTRDPYLTKYVAFLKERLGGEVYE